MNDLDRISAAILDVLNSIIHVILQGVVWLENFIRGLLAPLGLGPHTQSLICC